MRKYCLFLLFLLSPLGYAQELHVIQAKAPQSVPFAQVFNVQYQLSYTPGYEITVDEKSLSKDFEIQQMTHLQKSPGTIDYTFTAIPFTLGKSTFTVTFQLKQGDSQLTQAEEPVYLEVTPVQVFKDKKFREIRSPFVPVSWFTWLLVLLAAAALIYILYLWRNHMKQKHQLLVRNQEDTRPSHVIALSKINALVQSGLWENRQYKLFYISLVDILREYLQRRFELDVSADTSTELLYRIKSQQTLQPFIPLLREVLTASDLVKFARAIPSEDQRNGHVKLLCNFVEETTPKPQLETEAKK